jgi:hypothetical protein
MAPVTPNSAYLYVTAAASLLQKRQLNLKQRKHYQLGSLMLNMMCTIHRSLEEEKKKLRPRRFNCYAKYQVPNEHEWNNKCDRLLLLQLMTPDMKLKIEQQAT